MRTARVEGYRKNVKPDKIAIQRVLTSADNKSGGAGGMEKLAKHCG